MDFDTLFTGPAVLAKQLELRWASATVASSAVPADSAVSSSDQDGILLEDAISGLPTGVYQQPSGNFTSQVWFASKLRCIGTFDSPEKASAAYVAVKADLAGVKQSANSAGKMNAAFDKAKKKAVEAVEATSEGGLPTGVYATSSGKFTAQIESEVMWGDKPRYIGIYDTPEEASAAYMSVRKSMEDAELLSSEKESTAASERGLPKGVHKLSSGNFQSMICWGGKQYYIGTFATREQASAAYMSVKKDLDAAKTSGCGADEVDAAFDEARKKAIKAGEETRKKEAKAMSKGGLSTGVRESSPGNFFCQIKWGGKNRTAGMFDTIEQASIVFSLISAERDLAGAKQTAAAFDEAKKKAVEAVEETRKAMSEGSLPTGVRKVASGNYSCQIMWGGKASSIGTFGSIEQASAAFILVSAERDPAGAKQTAAAFEEAKTKTLKALTACAGDHDVARAVRSNAGSISTSAPNENRCIAMGRPYLRRNLLYCRDPVANSRCQFRPGGNAERSKRAVQELPPLDMLTELFDHTEPERYNEALDKTTRTPLRKRKRRITPTTTPENKRIQIGENWRKVKHADLVPNTRVLIAYKEKDLFRATVREINKKDGKYRVHYDSYKKDKTYVVPFSDFRALLDEDDCPIEITPLDRDSTSASSSLSSPKRTKLFFDVQMAQSPSKVLSPSTAEMQYGKAFPPYEPRNKSNNGKGEWNQPRDHRTAFELFAESTREQARLHLKRRDRKNKDKIDEQLEKLWTKSSTTTALYYKQEAEWDKQRFLHEQDIYTKARQCIPSPSSSGGSKTFENRSTVVPKRVTSVSYYYFHQRKGLPVAQIERRNDCRCPLCYQNCITDIGCVMHCQLVHGGDLLSFEGMKDEEGTLHIAIHPKAPTITNTTLPGTPAGAGIGPIGCSRITSHQSGWDPADALRQKPLTNSRVRRDFVYSRHGGRGPILTEVPLLRRSGAAGRKRKHELTRSPGADEDAVGRSEPDDPIPVRQYYHSKTNLPKRHNEWNYDSDDESDDSWMEMKSNQLIDEFDDVSEKEKDFLKLWNKFMSSSHKLVADRSILSRCVEFTKLHGTDIAERGMRQQLFLHFTNLWDEEILSSDHVSALMSFYDRHCAATADTGKIGKSRARSVIPRAAKSPNHHRKKTPSRPSVSSPGRPRMSASRKRAKRCIAF